MLEKLDILRKAPQPVKERIVALVSIISVVCITIIWFAFVAHSFFSSTGFFATSTPSQSAPQMQNQAPAQTLPAPPSF